MDYYFSKKECGWQHGNRSIGVIEMKKAMILLCSLLVMFVVFGCEAESGKETDVATSKYSKEVQSFAKEVQAGNYVDAIDVYNNKLYGNAALENEASLFLQDFLFENLDAFNQEAITETEFSSVLMSVQKVDDTLQIITFALTDAQEQFDVLVDSKANYKNGLSYMDDEEYLNAADCFASVSSLDMNYEAAQSSHDDAMKSYSNQIIKSVEEKISNGEYQTAVGIIDSASQYTGWLSEYDELLSKAYTLEAEGSVKSALEANDYAAAKSAYNSYQDNTYVLFSAEVITQLEEAKSNYRNSIKGNAQAFADASDYAAALKTIENGLEVLEDDSDLLQFRMEMQASYEDYLLRTTPVSLVELEAYDELAISSSNSAIKDISGCTYSSYLVSWYSGDKYATYRINRMYTMFTGTFFVGDSESGGDINRSRKVIVYGDDKELFETTVNISDDPTQFNIDVTGVKDLKIQMDGGTGGTYLGDPILTP